MDFPPPQPSSESQSNIDHDDPPPPSTLEAFPPDPFSEPSPPHQHHPSPFSDVPSPPPQTPEPYTEQRSGPTLLQVGTAIVIGAMAANVIGFRYSRWAVGKELHRAWENQQRQHASQRMNTQAARRAREAEARRTEAEARRMREEEERRRREARFDQRAREDREKRNGTRRSYAQWERVFGGGGFRVEIDQRTLEELLRGGRRGVGSKFEEDVLREFFKATRGGIGGRATGRRERGEGEFEDIFRMFENMGRRTTGRGAEDFDAFRFWERVQGEQWRGAGSAGMGGMGGDGVFGRGDLNRHYSTLGLKRGASDKEIKEAYRREAMKWHPDRYRGNDSEQAAKKFREITEAYNALTKT